MSKRAASPEVIDLTCTKEHRVDGGDVKTGNQEPSSAGRPWPDAPFHLMASGLLQGTWPNHGALGMRLGTIIRGPMEWCLASNYVSSQLSWRGKDAGKGGRGSLVGARRRLGCRGGDLP